ncbi:penicillin-insensitive murein endopeptidase [Rhizobium sp. BR 314]|uniref:penicillin-insensitive murein endopeptidase n=1 Tax=Rhizobium sp. BR 314 TaxID=3040013 RepID=UPI0039BF6200
MVSLLARTLQTIGKVSLATTIGIGLLAGDVLAQQTAPSPGSAKAVFGAVTLPTAGPSHSIGFYAKGCLAGAVALPADGPTWQAMRLSRNRRWGRPEMIGLLERLARDAAKNDGWPGLLVGDISQPRGGPMFNGHASHQIGLDADVWLTPMPRHKLSAADREALPFTSMLAKDKFLTINDKVWTPAHARLLMRAASYPEVERIFINPAIKKKMCDSWTGDRSNLGKLRPEYGHDSHFHIRLRCPPGSEGCTGQAPVAAGDGCDKTLAWWLGPEPWAKPKPSTKPPVKPREVMVSDLPKACGAVLAAPAAASARAATSAAKPADAAAETEAMPVSGNTPPGNIPQQ